MRKDLLYLRDALHAVERIEEYLAPIGTEELLSDRLRLDAVLRNLQIVSEATKHIPDDLRERQPHIPWKSIAGIRNKLVHHYFAIDPDIIVDICANHIKPLHGALAALAAEFPELDLDENKHL